MHYRATRRFGWSVLWVCAASTLLFAALKYDLERAVDEDDTSAAALFADHCGTCHQATDLDLGRHDEAGLLRFLDTHSDAGRAEHRDIVDWLRRRPDR